MRDYLSAKKWILFILLVVFFSIIFVVSKNKNNDSDYKITQNKEENFKNLLKYQDIVKINIDWLNLQKDENGFYNSMLNCNSDSRLCKKIESRGSGHEGIVVVWSKFKNYLINANPNDINEVHFDLAVYANAVEKMEIQNDFWNCKLMYEMWSNDFLNEDAKKNAEKICWSSYYLSAENIETFTERDTAGNFMSSKTILNSKSKEIDLKNKPVSVDNKVKGSINNFVGYGSDFIFRYIWKDRQEDLDLAIEYFNKSAGIYLNNKSDLNSSQKCILAISALDIYSVNKKEDYSEFAINIYNEVIANGEYKNVECGLLSDALYQKFRENSYSSNKYLISDYIINEYFDFINYKSQFESRGGFFKVNSDKSLGLIKDIRENALINVLLNSLWQ